MVCLEEMEQEKRIRALEMFTKGETRFMIATDVASRGLDVPDISHVINYDLPFSADVYVHRIGRTAQGHVSSKTIPEIFSSHHLTGSNSLLIQIHYSHAGMLCKFNTL